MVSTKPLAASGALGPRTHAVFALGCKVSQIDALQAGEKLSRRGGIRVEETQSPDVLIVQTCSVTDRADRDSRRLIRKLRQEHPASILVATGCLAQRDPDGLARLPEVDLVLGLGQEKNLPEILDELAAGALPEKTSWRPLDVPGGQGRSLEALAAVRSPDRTRAFLKIQDGCERRCSYCIVPFLRGRETSLSVSSAEEEIRRLAASGVQEAVLAGVHLSNFGKERGENLLSLIGRLEKNPPGCRIRLSSLEPMEAGDDLLDAVAQSKTVTPHLHLPLQSGSARVLRRMRRGMTPERYFAMAQRVTRLNPRLHLATDVIAGFPGETEEEFEETRSFLLSLPFASLHVFPFSPRTGTYAAELATGSGVSGKEISVRARLLRELGAEFLRGFARRAAGQVADIVSLRGHRGLTDNYLEVDMSECREAPPPGCRFLGRVDLADEGMLRLTSLID